MFLWNILVIAKIEIGQTAPTYLVPWSTPFIAKKTHSDMSLHYKDIKQFPLFLVLVGLGKETKTNRIKLKLSCL